MPIYAYRCQACGFAKDVLQKVSDPQLTVCLSCGQPTFKKQLTAAGFQLKGTGWYATDFRQGAGAAPSAGSESDSEGKSGGEKTGDDKGAGEKGTKESGATDQTAASKAAPDKAIANKPPSEKSSSTKSATTGAASPASGSPPASST